MKSKWNIRKRSLLYIMLFFGLLCSPLNISAETEDVIAEAKKGIVEIFSGFVNKDGKFCKIKSGSGFLISNTEGATYIVTNSSIIQNSNEEKLDYCKANKIVADDYTMTDAIYIVIKGDVTVEASVLTKSEELDFCILSTSNVVNEKIPLKLGNQAELSTGDTVYTLGFPADINGVEFSTEDVEIYQGNIQDKTSGQDGVSYIQHSAVVLDGNTGGPMLDEAGYVVGINCKKYTDAKSNRYYSLPVGELLEILDNFAIDYGSQNRDQLQTDFISLYEECRLLNESGDYKKNSLISLQEALDEAGKLIEAGNPSVAQMESLYQSLTEAKNQLVPKIKKILIAIYILAGMIGIFFICLTCLLVLRRRDKKNESQGKTFSINNEEFSLKHPEEKEVITTHQNFDRATKEKQEKPVVSQPYQEKETVRSFTKEDTYSDRKKVLEMIRKRNGQKATVNKARYIIGRSPKQSDWVIADNPTIGRTHACICWKNSGYELCDLGALNGTYLNGKKMSEDMPLELKNGDFVKLSDEEFMIHIFERD